MVVFLVVKKILSRKYFVLDLQKQYKTKFCILIPNQSKKNCISRPQPRFFLGEEIPWDRGTSINVSCTTYKRWAREAKCWCFFFKLLLKLHFKREFNPNMHTYRIRALFIFSKRAGETSNS